MLRKGGKIKLLSTGNGFTIQNFTGELSEVDSAIALKQVVKE